MENFRTITLLVTEGRKLKTYPELRVNGVNFFTFLLSLVDILMNYSLGVCLEVLAFFVALPGVKLSEVV